MNLYLMRHGEAVRTAVDAAQPLSDRGRDGVRRVASALATAGVRVDRVVHSGKTRARQTAESIGAVVLPDGAVERIQGIAPLDRTDVLADMVRPWTEDTMVVGHLPFMDRMVSRLVLGNEGPSLVEFNPATVVCLSREGDETWRISWVVKPEMLRGTD